MAGARGEGKRVALITGAGGVIGAAVSERLHATGWAVAGVDLTPPSAALVDVFFDADVSERAALAHVAKSVRDELGPIDLLVTAANDYESAPIGALAHERWQRMVHVNLGGTVNACAAVVPSMVEARRGTVVTTTSWLALAGGERGEAYYAASIGAVIAFTKSFALEVAKHGVRVNCIAIGPTDSGEPGALAGETGQRPRLAGRLARPSDVAETVAFLADEGDFYVGQVFRPCAGAVI